MHFCPALTLLMVVGASPQARGLVGLIDGVRESARSWKELLLDLKQHGLAMGPELASPRSLGFWKALPEVWPRTREQRCWVHKRPTSSTGCRNSARQSQRAFQNIWMAETRKDAEAAFDKFAEIYRRGRRQGGRVPGQGSRRAASSSSTSRRALEAFANNRSV